MKTAAYIGWLGHSNIGDEACLLAVQQFLGPDIRVVPWDTAPWREEQTPDVCILGGGTLLDTRYGRREKTLLFPMCAANVPIVTWGTGVVQLYTSKVHPKVQRILNYSKFVGVRGPVSKAILDERGFRNANVIGDPALFLETPCEFVPAAKPKIALNLGFTNNNLYGTEAHVIQQGKKAVKKLHAAGFDIVLFSVWPKDNAMLQQVSDGKCTIRTSCTLGTTGKEVLELINFLKTCHCVVGMKLHACVLSAAAGVPFISLAYRLKCIDFMHSLGFNTWHAKTNTDWSKIVLKKVPELLAQRTEFCAQVITKKNEYVDKHHALARLVHQLAT